MRARAPAFLAFRRIISARSGALFSAPTPCGAPGHLFLRIKKAPCAKRSAKGRVSLFVKGALTPASRFIHATADMRSARLHSLFGRAALSAAGSEQAHTTQCIRLLGRRFDHPPSMSKLSIREQRFRCANSLRLSRCSAQAHTAQCICLLKRCFDYPSNMSKLFIREQRFRCAIHCASRDALRRRTPRSAFAY